MESKRQQKVARLVQKELGEIFQRDTKHLFGNAFITVTLVKMSPDLSIANIQLSLFNMEDGEGFIAKINKRKAEVRKLLGNRIGKQMRIVPNINFHLDATEERARRLDKLIDSLDIPKADDDKD